MKLGLLKRVHKEMRPESLERNRDLFVGGDQLRDRIERYLPQNDLEPADVYKRRCSTAHYVNYVAPLVNLFASWLFTCEPAVKPVEGEAPPFYAEFGEDCDGQGTDLDSFLRARIVDALVDKRAFFRVAFPEPAATKPATLKDYEDSGAGRATLVAMPASTVTNWKRDARGKLEWLLEYTRADELLEITDESATITETWTLWRSSGEHQRWQLVRKERDAITDETPVPEVAAPFDPTEGMPVIDLVLPPEMCLVENVASAQLELFRKRCATSWGIDRTCYAMMVLTTKGGKDLPGGRAGAGYYLKLREGESLSWPTPPSTPFDVIGQYTSTLKDEIHRVAIAMAQGVDNNAAAVGRSGESKEADADATTKVLHALGKLVVLVDERAHDVVSRGRGEDLTWTASGMDEYSSADFDELLMTVTAVDQMEIPSPTLKRELRMRAAMSALKDADDATRAKVRAEIEAAAEEEAAVEAERAKQKAQAAEALEAARQKQPAPPFAQKSEETSKADGADDASKPGAEGGAGARG